MHDLIEQMGCEIVRQESTEDPGKRSRLRNREDVYHVLKNNRGTDSIEGIRLDLNKIKSDILLHADSIEGKWLDLSYTRGNIIYLHADTFKKMPKLRILQIVDDEILPSPKFYIAAELESFSDELRYLEWNRCPLRSLPSSFCAEKFVELRMPRSSELTKLWDGVQDLVNLEIIDLQECNQLVELPDFTLASKLRAVVLSNCSSLCRVHPSILCIPTLEVLRLDGCRKLKSLVGKIHFEYLHDLQVYDCDSLQEFSVTSKKIRSLNLRGTKIDVLHSSIGRLSKLETFRLSSERIKCLPDELCLLTSLLELDLSRCSEIIELPGNIKALTRLTTLRIRDCRRLQYLPELPSSITRLDAINCTLLNWTMFSFHDTLMPHAIIDYINLLQTNTDKGLEYYGWCDVCYPGSQVPEWFRYQTTKASSIYLELDQPLDQLLGFFLCCVSSMDSQYYLIKPHCYLRDGERGRFKIKLRSVWMKVRLISDHVLIWCDHENKLLDEIKQYRVNDLCTTNSQTISLEFVITDKVVKGGGISPICVRHP